ncbi:MAG: signal peptidase I [Planctomycetota bacterium]
MTRSAAAFVRDNLEAFAVAIAMALVIRHYCIEAFRIPTGSMMPSLYGDDPVTRRQGDRILVDKFAYLRREPRRWEVVVFLFPLNKGKNFIKRLVGLPDEWLHIRRGDIWTSTDEGKTWAIRRKPPGARDQLLFPYYPQPPEDPAVFEKGGNWETEKSWSVDEGAGLYEVDAGGEDELLKFLRQVVPSRGVDNGMPREPYCGDVRVSFDLEVARGGVLTVGLREHGQRHRLVLGANESYAVIAGADGEVRHPLDVRLAAGSNHAVSFANVDDTLVVDLDGDVFEFEFPPRPLPDSNEPSFRETEDYHEITLGARGLKATLRDVCIDRDVYYNANKKDTVSPWKIPADHFFVLGDNTRSSRDSREWRVDVAKMRNGDIVRWDASPSDAYHPSPGGWDDDELVVISPDIDGLVRRFQASDVVDIESNIAWPFVPRKHLIGRAFCIFWPIYIPPLYTRQTRVNLIR